MIGQTISHYKILEKLGEGGMGVVYKAHDTKLDRIVALKFLPHHLTAQETERSRFLQEARAAAALNHPNACSVIDIQEMDGQQFIIMEYVDGTTLRHKLPIQKIDDAIGYALQIGDALNEAHSKGIVHRDIKAENIMVNSKNQIKVMDFGLAKLKGSLKLTRTSSTVGTLAYMAPEQIQGGDVDARSDIFSFGVVLFEMLAGRMPFRGEHEAAMMYSILNEEPESIQKLRSDVPAEIDRILHRALEKDPADRYQHIDDMISEIRRTRKQSTRVVRPEMVEQSMQSSPRRAGVRSRKNLLWVGMSTVVLIGIVLLFVLRKPNSTKSESHTDRKMLAVLPFENLGSADQEYFADGITEEITSKLSGLSGLGVIARSSAMQYKKTTKPVKQIGEELGVSYILQGTIRWENTEGTSRVRVNPQLISVVDGTQIWSQPSEAVLASAFKLQSEIAGQVANALNLTLLQHEKQVLEAKLTDNSEAYDFYLRGKGYLYRSFEERDYRIAEQMLQRAVELDPKFAAAYAGLGNVHAAIYWEFYDHSTERVQKSKEAAEKALQLDPELPDAHGAMGWYYYHCLRDFDNALREFNLALEKQPNNTDVLLGVASVNRRQGKFDDAIVQFKRTAEINPRSPDLLVNVAETYAYVRKYAEAEQYYLRAIDLAPDIADSYAEKADLYLTWEGHIPEARKVLDEARQRKVGQQDPYFLYYLFTVDILDGKYQEVAKRLDSLDMKVFDNQNWYIPKEILSAQLNGYLKQPQKQHAYYDAARIVLEREIQKYPDDARLHSSLGIAYAGIGRKGDAVREGKYAVSLLPITKEAMVVPIRMQDLAQIYTMIGEQDAAIDELERLLSIPSLLSVPLLRLDPTWNPLRNNSRFQKLIAEK